jgi:hypothetical protein
MQIPGALPSFLKVWWVTASPFAFLFAARILWEKTIWTWSRGPQMVGFALWHSHPGFAFIGVLCSFAVSLWLPNRDLLCHRAWPRYRTLGLADDGGFGGDHCGIGNS